jgi:hypothetical protein
MAGFARFPRHRRRPQFVAGDQMVAAVEVYRPEKGGSDGTLTVRIERADGSPSGFNERRAVHAAGPRSEEIGVPIDTAKLRASQYLLRMTLEAPGGERVERVIRSKSWSVDLRAEGLRFRAVRDLHLPHGPAGDPQDERGQEQQPENRLRTRGGSGRRRQQPDHGRASLSIGAGTGHRDCR